METSANGPSRPMTDHITMSRESEGFGSVSLGRRGLLGGGLGLAGVALLGAPSPARADSALRDTARRDSARRDSSLRGSAPGDAGRRDIAALEEKYATTIGLSATNLATGRTLRHRDNLRLPFCSTFKPLAAAVLLRDEDIAGEVLATEVPVRREDLVPNSDIFEAHIGSTMTYAEFCDAAIRYSDNASANMILRRIGGPAAVTAFMRSLGDRVTRLDRWEPELNESLPHDLRDTTSAAALASSYTKLLLGDALEPKDRARLLDWMLRNQTSGALFGAGVPEGWPLADKTGGGEYGSRNDVGITWTPGGAPIVIAALTRTGVEGQSGPDACLAELASVAVARLR